MKFPIPNYFLRRINKGDINFPFETSLQKFNKPSGTLKEFFEEDINNGGKNITFIFEREEGLRLGLARYRIFTLDEFINTFDRYFPQEIFDKIVEEIIKQRYFLVYMSRVGILDEFKGIGFGSLLQNFIDAHARITYPNFLLFAKTTLDMFELIKSRYSEDAFKKRYIYSGAYYSHRWEVDYRVIMRRILDGRNMGNYTLPLYNT